MIMAGMAGSRNDYTDVTSMAYSQLKALQGKLGKMGGSSVNAAHFKFLAKEIGQSLSKGEKSGN